MKTLSVSFQQHHYPIYIGADLLNNTSLFQKHIRQQQVMIFSNELVAQHYLKPLKVALSSFQADIFLLPEGERYKNETHWREMIDALVAHQHHRDTTLIALGGGVVGDMTGFAAACYHRGVAYLQIPTTLLAQVDASIGGKTAINHAGGKNLIGAFHQPSAVFIDITTLNTLPNREFNAGLAEVVKAALVHDADFFAWLEANHSAVVARDANALSYAIEKACDIKRQIVMADEKETRGIRALLNLGHTFGHAIEHVQNYSGYLHGEAVAIGLCLAAKTSVQRGWLSEADEQRIERLLSAFSLPARLPSEINCDTLLCSMMMDKKIINQKHCLILLQAIGQGAVAHDVPREMLNTLLQG